MMRKNLLNKYAKQLDIILFPFVILSALILRKIRKMGINGFPKSKKTLLKMGVFPITDHYYEPLFNPKHLYKELSLERKIKGINWNLKEQLQTLESFDFQDEFKDIPEDFVNDFVFNFKNDSFESGDAEYWYNMIRLKKPRNIIEIGSGNSTKIARLAIEVNKKNNDKYECNHICIEPYEMPWLEKIGVKVIRDKVENIDLSFFDQLEANDFLFIDSSHVIRPQGDVLFEFLELIPNLKNGVIIHVHDIFSPRDYPKEWIIDQVRLWNEQYLLEAFLSFNNDYKIIGALNLLYHNQFELLKNKCPRITKNGKEPSSIYILKS